MANQIVSKPLVAIVTPVYNGGKHLEDTIRAVQAQTYRPLVHCILDNASTDETAEIIVKYSNGDVPIVTKRNPETVPFHDNWNGALKLIPPEAKYFRQLHADDGLPPDAIEAMMEVALSAEDIVMVAGVEHVNGIPRPSYFPSECSVFDASNALARHIVDEAHLPSAHVLFPTDALREDEEFYPHEFIECGIAAIYRELAKGGRMGFVHKYNADTRRYEGSGSLIMTHGRKVRTYIIEKLIFMERFGPAHLTNTEYKMVRNRYLRVIYRKFMFWAATKRMPLVTRDLGRLRERGIHPSLWDFIMAVLVFPLYRYNSGPRVWKTKVGNIRPQRRILPHAPLPWPEDAVKPSTQRQKPSRRSGQASAASRGGVAA